MTDEKKPAELPPLPFVDDGSARVVEMRRARLGHPAYRGWDAAQQVFMPGDRPEKLVIDAGNLVPANDVRALLGVLGSDRAATKGLVTTTSDFAPKIVDDPFIAPYIPTRLELVNGRELVRRLSSLRNKL